VRCAPAGGGCLVGGAPGGGGRGAAPPPSPVPVILGGHSLVGGALELLNQWAWDEHDAAVGGGGSEPET
jgi:hypothetical protein